jgi:TM2 domain-containing membrane protein YozV
VVCTSCGAALAGKATTQVNAALAGILNWLWGGVAYFLLGQTTKGIVFSVLTLCMWILSLVTCGIGFVIFGVYDVVLIIDAVMLVGRANRGESLGDWQFF